MRSFSKTLRAIGLLAALGLLLLPAGSEAAPRCGEWADRSPQSATEHELRTSVLCLVNLARNRHGVPPLGFNLELRESATLHSRSMVRSGSFSHYGPGDSTMTSRIVRAGYLARAGGFRLAENIATGWGRANGSPLAIVRAWMHSPEHRRNILDAGLHDFGVGVARGGPFGGGDAAATYTLDFGSRG
jgi:uncharacterized protein YkwD